MTHQNHFVKYTKPSKTYGVGMIPLGTIGRVILEIKHPVTDKMLVKFDNYGLAVVPSSAVEFY